MISDNLAINLTYQPMTSLETPYYNAEDGEFSHNTTEARFSVCSSALHCGRHAFPVLGIESAVVKPLNMGLSDELFDGFVRDIQVAMRDVCIGGRIWELFYFYLLLVYLFPSYFILVLLLLFLLVKTYYERVCLEGVIQNLIEKKWQRKFHREGYQVTLLVEKGWGNAESHIHMEKLATPPPVMDTGDACSSAEREYFWIVPYLRKAKTPTIRFAFVVVILWLGFLFVGVNYMGRQFIDSYSNVAADSFFALVVALWLLRPVILEQFLFYRIRDKIPLWQEKLHPHGFTINYGRMGSCFPTSFLEIARTPTL